MPLSATDPALSATPAPSATQAPAPVTVEPAAGSAVAHGRRSGVKAGPVTRQADQPASRPTAKRAANPVTTTVAKAVAKKAARVAKVAKTTTEAGDAAAAPARDKAVPTPTKRPAVPALVAEPGAAEQPAEAAAAKLPRVKEKLVRDSFTMPRSDFALIAALKDRALKLQRPAKKSELLRAGLQALQGMDDGALLNLLNRLPLLKTGRPKKADQA